MIPVTSYLIRAYHQWIEDNTLSAHILVDCTYTGVVVPKQFIQQDKIVLNIASQATNALIIDNDAVRFKARFSGKSIDVFVPMSAVLGIYAGENGEGMFFESGTNTVETAKKPALTLLE